MQYASAGYQTGTFISTTHQWADSGGDMHCSWQRAAVCLHNVEF